MSRSVTAFSPASIGNVAVGFDILGQSIDGAGDHATVRRIDEPTVRVDAIRGVVRDLPLDAARNTAGRALIAMRNTLNLPYGFAIELDKGIALGSGMGGSAASCVAATVAANALLDDPLAVDALYPFALAGESVASGSVHGDNVSALRVAGSFDDCQRLVKQALNDDALQAHLPLSSANSISLGRLLPQMSYYAHSSLTHWRAHGDTLNYVIPTGNLGNALAAILARSCGLPIGKIVLATNANRVVPDFFAGAEYLAQPSIATLANAMDVGAPSNFERLRWLYPDASELRGAFEAHAVSDVQISETIHNGEARYGEVFCPHTACAIHVLEGLRARGANGAWAVVATAHPAKFEQIVEPLVGHKIEVPSELAALLAREAVAEPMLPDPAALIARLARAD